MSEWQSVLKSTSIEKQTSNEVMDKFVENLGKVIADYQKEQQTNQSTTATQPTQPTQAPSVAGRADTITVGGNKPASGYKTYTSEEIQALRGAGVSTSEIKRLDTARAKNMQKPPSLAAPAAGVAPTSVAGNIAPQKPLSARTTPPTYTASQANIDRAMRRLPPWAEKLRERQATAQVTQQEGQPATSQVRRDSYDRGEDDSRTRGLGPAKPVGGQGRVKRTPTQKDKTMAQQGLSLAQQRELEVDTLLGETLQDRRERQRK